MDYRKNRGYREFREIREFSDNHKTSQPKKSEIIDEICKKKKIVNDENIFVRSEATNPPNPKIRDD